MRPNEFPREFRFPIKSGPVRFAGGTADTLMRGEVASGLD